MPTLAHLLNLVGTFLGFLSALILSVDTVGDVRARQVMRRIGGVWRLFDRADPETGISASFVFPVTIAGVVWVLVLYAVPSARQNAWWILGYLVVTALALMLLRGFLVSILVQAILYIRRQTKMQNAGWVGFLFLMLAFICQLAATFLDAFGTEPRPPA